jgi:hypothetical protein
MHASKKAAPIKAALEFFICSPSLGIAVQDRPIARPSPAALQ